MAGAALEPIRQPAEKRPEEALRQMERARDLAADAYEEVRRSVRALGPLSLDERSGAGALRALVRSFDGTGFDVHFRVEGNEKTLPESSELLLYRALQEGLTNTVRHSGARRVDACLSYGDVSVRLVVADDGRGVPKEHRTVEGGSGLRALEERIGALGGTFAAGNGPRGGFVLEVELPVRERP